MRTAALLLLTAPPADAGPLKPPPAAVKKLCFECHDADTAEAELDLEAFGAGGPAAAAAVLRKVRRAVAGGRMPPDYAAAAATDADRKAVLAWAEGNLDRLAAAADGSPGRVVMARLTRYEYRNALRDLSGGAVTDAGRFLPSEGGAGEGFANVGQAQGISAAQVGRYIEAAKGALRHLRVDPVAGFVWSAVPREPVRTPAQARDELVADVIAWHVGQQQKWGEEHRDDLTERLGFSHAAYLIAAYRHRHRADRAAPLASFAECGGVRLAPAALAKWRDILNGGGGTVFAGWAKAWRALPAGLGGDELRGACVRIAGGRAADAVADFAPPYEVSYREDKAAVLAAAEKEKYWPFRIDIGAAKRLYLVATHAGDGNRGEYAVWRRGRLLFADGSSRPWQAAVTVVGANSGRAYKWGVDGEGAAALPADAVGVRPPGVLRFDVPEGARTFEVELAVDRERSGRVSIQALVLKGRPRSSGYVRGRRVFGGKPRGGASADKELARALRRRNVSEANKTKVGLNAERNVFAGWSRTKPGAIGGPWPGQDADRRRPGAPYHYTVAEVMRNATPEDLAGLRALQDRLAAAAAPAGAAGEAANLRPRLARFARLAWRRSPSAAEVDRLMALFTHTRRDGASHDAAAKLPLLAVLASPHFLYRDYSARGARGGAAVPLTGRQLASRLSFFLWASVPDGELLNAAESGALSDPAVLRRQARRMLKDPRARSLARDFSAQLWDFADFVNFDGPDAARFPEFTPGLRRSMYTEVVTFLDGVYRGGRPLTDLIDSDYTFADAALARHYGLPAAGGGGFRRVNLGPRRGGLAGMALFLTKSSLPLRTSPVQRGVWVLEYLLGDELPDPPAGVPSLSDDDKNERGQTVAEQLAEHRAAKTCASCHDKIDPLGLSLENYDPIGRWREVGRGGTPLTSRAATHDGVDLDGAAALRRYVAGRRDDVFGHFNRKLLGYALGRAVGPGDRELLKKMGRRLEANGHRFAALVDAVVTSRQFMTAAAGE